ncbi:MAG TPA: hypothetical protein VIN59_08125, partial [Alphaproteobacteria bacterium]
LAHVTAGFAEHVYLAFLEYSMGTQKMDDDIARIEVLSAHYKFRKPAAEDKQRDLRRIYTSYLQASRQVVLSLAYLWRNSAFLPAVNDRPFYNKIVQHLNLNTHLFTNKDMLQADIENMQLPFLTNLIKVASLMKPSRWEAQPGFENDPYVHECLDGWMISSAQFNDWVEYNFFRTYQIPLGMLRCTPEGALRINHNIQTIDYCKQLVSDMTEPAPDLRLQTRFPGISLDGMPKTNAHFKFMIPYVVEYVSKPFGPHAAIIPTRRVSAKRPDYFAALRQK